ncbi:MAG: hypothetical protein V3V20_04375 [Algisphaera sp.]
MTPCDTPPDVQAVQDEIHRRMSDDERLAHAFRLTALARAGIRDRLRRQYPLLEEEGIHRQMIYELYGVRVGG